MRIRIQGTQDNNHAGQRKITYKNTLKKILLNNHIKDPDPNLQEINADPQPCWKENPTLLNCDLNQQL